MTGVQTCALPIFDSPPHAVAAAHEALDAGLTHYGPFAGLPELRAAVADEARSDKGIATRPEDVFITVGGKGVMVYALLALIDPGDEVILPDPTFPIYASLTRYLGGIPVPIPLRMEDGFALDPERVAAAITPRTKLLILNSPANPTGGVLGGRRSSALRSSRSRMGSSSSRTRSTAASCTTTRSTSRSRACPGWRSARSSSMASRRPTR